MSAVYYPLAKACIALKDYKFAYNLLLNASSAYPYNTEIKNVLKQLVSDHPELLKEKEAASQKNRRLITPPRVLPLLEGRTSIPEIRIGLVEKIQKMYIKTGGDFTLSNLVNGRQISGISRTVLVLRVKDGMIEAADEQGRLLLKSGKGLRLSYADPSSTTALFDVEYGQGVFWSGQEDRFYRGKFDFLLKNSMMTVVNQLNIEEYLYSVVPCEMESHWPPAALQAQAVAARTYAFANMGSYSSRGFDLLSTVSSQAYYGVRRETPSARAAVDASRGKIQVYDGKPISAFYTGNSGGYTTDPRDLWGFSLPYLKAVPDKKLSFSNAPLSPRELADWLTGRPQTYSSVPGYSSRSAYRWTLWVSRTDLEKRLGQGDKLGRIKSVTVTERGTNGMAAKVTIRGENGSTTVKGDAIRSKLGKLRSNLFIVEPKMGSDGLPEFFIFSGAGWGHGIGMDQSGAAGMAADGYTCEEILRHYYPGTETVKKY